MKFYGNGIEWDSLRDKPLCEFQDGVYETEDYDVANRLIESGFRYEGELPAVPGQNSVDPPNDASEMTNEQLKGLLDAKGIEYKARATKAELIQLLGGAE